jgi:bacterioferritin
MQEEIGHADEFMNRIIFLKGEPQMLFDKQPKVAASLQEMFKHDMDDEKNAIEFYTVAARRAGEAGDIGSRMLFEKIAVAEEGHMAWLELQLELIKRIGEPAYIAKHMSIPGAAAEA